MIEKNEEYILNDEERVRVVGFERDVQAIDSEGIVDEQWTVEYKREELL